MEFTQSATYPLDVDSVIRMSTDPAFLDMRFGRFMAANPEVTVEGDTITYVGTVNPELIPAIARPFTKNGITLTFTEAWTRTEEGATAHTEVAVGGAPVSAAVDSTLTPDGDGCARALNGTITVNVPLVGGRVEKEAVARVGHAFDREHQLAAEWAAEQG